MNKIVILFACFILASCIQDDKYTHKIVYRDVIYVGDQMCREVVNVDDGNAFFSNEDYKKTAPYVAGIFHNCIAGRMAADIERIPESGLDNGWRVAFIAIGENDQFSDADGGNVDSFKEKYQAIIDNSIAEKIVCVLPSKSNNHYRYAIMSMCANVADPYDYGVVFKSGIKGLGVDDQRGMLRLIFDNI